MSINSLVYDRGMKTSHIVVAALVATGAILAACNSSGLAEKPRANFAHLACLDVNGDARVNSADAADLDQVPDFNADDEHDAFDASFVEGVDIPLAADAAQACTDGTDDDPEYLVAHDFLQDADVTCEPGDRAVLVVGIAGGVDDLKDDDQAAGVREIVNAIISKLEGQEIQTIGVIAGSAMYGAENAHAGMEDWLTNAIQVYLDRFPCLDVAMVGFSHGGVTVAVLAARLEARDGDRIVASVALDRIEEFYGGDLTAMPRTSPLVNVYQTNTPGGFPVEGANVFNYDASGDMAPADGDKGGELKPVTHVTIDNSESVRDMIAGIVLARETDAATRR